MVEACALALKLSPGVNSSWAGDKIIQHHHADVAMAVAGSQVTVAVDAVGGHLAEQGLKGVAAVRSLVVCEGSPEGDDQGLAILRELYLYRDDRAREPGGTGHRRRGSGNERCLGHCRSGI